MGLKKDSLIEFVSSIGILILLWSGACSVVQSTMTLGALVTFYTLLSYFLTPIENLIELQSGIQEAVIAADRLNDIMDASLEEEHQSHREGFVSGDVEFEHVFFRYGNRQLTLQDISMKAVQGQQIALVGGSGCGKTTVAKLLMGFYNAEAGGIRIGGKNINDIAVSDLRRNLAYVPQETFLFSASVRDNLLLGEVEVDDNRLESVLTACDCEFVKKLPFGMDTVLEENGANLSGGQRQRLAIARAMLRNPQILILDEATSSLDNLTEKRVMHCIHELNPDMTVIMSAHRLNTVRCCDKIFVLDCGRVVEEGTHKNLLDNGGLYSEMWKSQNS